jgi:hypothetical protein
MTDAHLLQAADVGQLARQFVFQGHQRLLRLAASRNVAGHLRGADDAAFAVANRRDGQGHVDQASVLGDPDGFVMLDPLARSQPAEDDIFFAVALGRNQHRHGASDGLVRRVAEQSLGPLVPGDDPAFERLADDRIVGRFDDRRQPRLGQVGVLAIGDIDEDVHPPDQLAGGVADRLGVGQHRGPRPVGPLDDDLAAVVFSPFDQRPGHPAAVVRQRRAVRGE